jgi:hypothetical protein
MTVTFFSAMHDFDVGQELDLGRKALAALLTRPLLLVPV